MNMGNVRVTTVKIVEPKGLWKALRVEWYILDHWCFRSGS